MLNHLQHQPASNQPLGSHWRGITLVEFIVVLIVLGTIVAFLLPSVRSARPAAWRTVSKNHLKQISLALVNYHDKYESYPPAFTVDPDGKPLHSWRTLILPFLELEELYNKIDLTKPWFDPANSKAAQSMPDVYRCPAAKLPENHTLTMGVIGPNAFFDPTGQPRIRADITDDHGLTITLIEVDTPNSAHWMAPQDADEQLILSLNKESKLPHSGGIFHSAMVNGSVKALLYTEIPAESRKALMTINGGEEIDDSAY